MENARVRLTNHAVIRAKQRKLEKYIDKRLLRDILIKKGIWSPNFKTYEQEIVYEGVHLVFIKENNTMRLKTLYKKTKTKPQVLKDRYYDKESQWS